VDGSGRRCPVAGFGAGDVGENDEQVGVEGLGQEAGGGVFVHDGFDTFERRARRTRTDPVMMCLHRSWSV
jgi:hypothetical protein